VDIHVNPLSSGSSIDYPPLSNPVEIILRNCRHGFIYVVLEMG